MNKYKFYSDAGHGWLRVSTRELMDMDMLSQISPYSYMSRSGKWVYLEEDCDLSKYLQVKAGEGNVNEWCNANVVTVRSERSSVRGYPNLSRQWLLAMAAGASPIR